ncbi:MAG: hypothetical protein JEZ14_24475 [Marinilabiliaceae bacterium]|nr:hypothetical protein [Marinilabiliaceae bacterium]
MMNGIKDLKNGGFIPNSYGTSYRHYTKINKSTLPEKKRGRLWLKRYYWSGGSYAVTGDLSTAKTQSRQEKGKGFSCLLNEVLHIPAQGANCGYRLIDCPGFYVPSYYHRAPLLCTLCYYDVALSELLKNSVKRVLIFLIIHQIVTPSFGEEQ